MDWTKVNVSVGSEDASVFAKGPAVEAAPSLRPFKVVYLADGNRWQAPVWAVGAFDAAETVRSGMSGEVIGVIDMAGVF